MTDKIISQTRAWLGTPYRHQASAIGAGCDCLGLVRGVWRALYGTEIAPVPPYGADWRDPGHGNQLLDAAQRYLVPCDGAPAAGQVILFRLIRHAPPQHCAIMVAHDKFIHAQEHLGVVEMAMSPSWSRRIAGTFAFPDTSEQ